MEINCRTIESNGLGVPDQLFVVGGDVHPLGHDGQVEFWTSLSIRFSPAPGEHDDVLKGQLEVPENGTFVFDGTLVDLTSLIKLAVVWRDVIKDPRVECWR